MRTCLALFCRAAITDLGMDGDEGRAGGIRFCLFDGFADLLQVVAVCNVQSLETKCSHTLLYILGKCDIGASLDGDAVGII